MEKKITKRQMFERIRAELTDEAEIAFIDHEIELLEKKNASRSSKPTPKQVENASLKEAILAGMEDGVSYRINAMIKAIPAISELSNQRVSALLRQLVEDGLVIREVIKRETFFKKA